MSKPSALVQIFVLTLLATLSASQRSSYGEICSKIQRCDRRAWLGCFSGTCMCVKPDEMIFETTTGKCASKAGERCKYALEHSDGSQSYEFTSCVENSVCGPDGFCTCGEDYYENASGTCSITKKYSEPCSAKAKCSSLSGLICNEGVCECSNRTSSYSLRENQCVGLVGHPCIKSKCTENSKCTSNKCVCNDNFYQNSDDECSPRGDLLENCTIDDQCKYKKGLKCVGGTCNCDQSISLFGTAKRNIIQSYNCRDWQGFHEDSYTQCLGKVGKPCIQDLCAPGSYCQYYHGGCSPRGPGTCVCIPGYSQSSLGTCGKGYNEGCESSDTCMDGIVCTGIKHDVNRCRCRYVDQAYDSNQRKCISPVGGPCDVFSGCGHGAECVNILNSSRGICQCRDGFVEGAFGECKVAFGGACTKAFVCDGVGGLNCIEGTCQCEYFKQFSTSTKSCLGLAGSKCDINLKIRQCVDNSSCLKVREEHTFGRCTCNAGHTVSENYTCDAQFSRDENSATVPVLEFPTVYDVETFEEEQQVV